MPRLRVLVPWTTDQLPRGTLWAEVDVFGMPIPIRDREEWLLTLVNNGVDSVATFDKLTLSLLAYIRRHNLVEDLELQLWVQGADAQWHVLPLDDAGHPAGALPYASDWEDFTGAAFKYSYSPVRRDAPPMKDLPTPSGWRELIHSSEDP